MFIRHPQLVPRRFKFTLYDHFLLDLKFFSLRQLKEFEKLDPETRERLLEICNKSVIANK